MQSANKVMLVTGGARGIGAATARLAARRGYDVAVNYVRGAQAAAAVVADIEKAGRRGVALRADVAEPAAVQELFAAVDHHFGRLDAFCNNAGILDRHSRFVDISLERLNRTLGVNLVGAFVANQEAVRRMSTRLGGRGGVIVNISSLAARLGGAFECLDYAVSKGAMDTMTIGLAKELVEEGIRVNGIRPGIIKTDIQLSSGEADRVGRVAPTIPMKRGGEPEEVAEAVLWLCSDAASYVTGITVEVAGGRGL
jgi:NAD(P)-dependent dehydrogenase (short-subunit alcohol dehydrogenase family)